MARSVSLNGTSFSLPQTGDSGWSLAGGVDDYLVALATGVLTKAGGTFTLSAEVNLGATFGLKSAYLKTQTLNPAAAGVLRLAKTDSIGWRNNANSADIALTIDASDNLTFNGTKVGLSGNIVNADISNTAAIAYSKLALTGAIQNADLAGSIAYSKLTLTGSVVNADVSATAAIAYSKLNLAGAVKLASDVTGLLPAANGGTGVLSTATFPTSGVVVTEAGTETLTNKTLTSPVIATIINTGTLTLPASTDTLVGRATTDTLTNKTLTSPVIGTIVNTGTLTLPTSTDTLVGRATTDTLTNKTLTSPTITTPTHTSYLDITEITTPSAPAASKLRLYSKSGDGLYFQGNATTETQLQAVTSKLTNFNSLADGSSGQVLTTLGSGTGYQWAAALTTTLNQYNLTVGNSSNIATAINTNLLGSITAQTASQTVTVTIATPGVLTTTTAPATGATVYLTTTGALPTGLSASTTYYAINVTATTLKLATTLGNALAGTAIATSGTQSGTHTMFTGGLTVGTNGLPGVGDSSNAGSGYVGEYVVATGSNGAVSHTAGSNAAQTAAGALTAGDWDVYGTCEINTSTGGNHYFTMGISTTSGTFGSTVGQDHAVFAIYENGGTTNIGSGSLRTRITVASGSTATVYLVAQTPSVDVTGSYASIQCRRVR